MGLSQRMSATSYLRLVFAWLPTAFFVDLMAFTGAVWVRKVWR